MLSLVRATERITCFFGLLAAWIVAPLIAAMVWEVVSRYLFSAPTSWAFEAAYMMMGASFMLGLGYAVQMRSHVRVDFIYGALPLRWRAAIDLIGFVLLLPVAAWITLGLWDYMVYAYVNNESTGDSTWNPVVWPFRVAFFAGFLLFTLQIAVELINSAHTIRAGAPLKATIR